MIKLFANGKEIEFTLSKFPAGESLVRLHGNGVVSQVQIEVAFQGNDDLINMLLLNDALKRSGETDIGLRMGYLPYARQDRVCNSGESLSIKVIADLINSCNFKYVICDDIHSDVGVALIDSLLHHELSMCAVGLDDLFYKGNTVLVSPDAGSVKKVSGFAVESGWPNLVQASKVRDTLTGELKSFKVDSSHIGAKDFLILDDICDGGGTFIGLAKELRKLTTGKIYLYVTHGIFSKGAEVFEGVIDGIFVYNMMGQPHKLIKELG